MKAAISTKVKFFLFFVMITLTVATTLAQSADKVNKEIPKYALTNLIKGLKSDNEGLREECINFVAKYEIKDAAEALTNLFSDEENPRLRVLIAKTLLQIADADGMDAVREAIDSEKDENARKAFAEIYSEYIANKANKIVGY